MSVSAGCRALGLWLGFCLVVTLGLVRPADAQILGRDRPERPSRALFGSSATGPTSQALTAGAGFGFGATKVSFDGAPADTAAPVWSAFNGGSANVSYLLDRVHFGINASLGVTGRRIEGGRTIAATDGTAEFVWSAPLSKRTSFGGALSESYRPVSVMTLFPSVFQTDASGLPLDYQLTADIDHYAVGMATVTLSHALTRKSTVSAIAEFTEAPASTTRPEQRTVAGGASYDYSLMRGVSFRLGYVTRVGDYTSNGRDTPLRSRTDSIDAGINYGRAISLSRRARLTLATGTTAISDGRSRRFDVTGNANLSYEIGRTWSAALVYDRRAGFVETLSAPSSSDNVTGALNGLFTRRISLDVDAGAARGQVGVTAGNTYWVYRGAMDVGFAFSRLLSVHVGYLAYRYRFDDTEFLPATTLPRVTGRTIQASLQFSAAIFQRVRKRNVAR